MPSASNVTRRSPAAAEAWTCAMLRTWRSSAKLGGTNSRRESAKNSSYSLSAPFFEFHFFFHFFVVIFEEEREEEKVSVRERERERKRKKNKIEEEESVSLETEESK